MEVYTERKEALAVAQQQLQHANAAVERLRLMRQLDRDHARAVAVKTLHSLTARVRGKPSCCVALAVAAAARRGWVAG